MTKMLTAQQFFKRFPTDDVCLEHLMAVRYGEVIKCPKCGREGRFYRIAGEPAYSCSQPRCGHHIHPMAGTPFNRTHTALQKWFFAMYLFCASRNGVSAKELQRQLGVTYKTAWRMGHEIRKYMGETDGDRPMSGHVEIDETLIGGVQRGAGKGAIRKGKTIVMGIVQRGGDVLTKIVPHTRFPTPHEFILKNVPRGTVVSTDEAGHYHRLPSLGYRHEMVNHSQDEWVKGIHHTNTIENFWSILKRSIRSTHTWVSKKHLGKYLGEFEYRFNMRHRPWAMFDRLILSF